MGKSCIGEIITHELLSICESVMGTRVGAYTYALARTAIVTAVLLLKFEN